jgi:hypothetical protein
LGAVANSIRTTVNKASEDAQDIWGAMYHDIGYVGAQITGAASRISQNFNTALGEANSLFTGTNAEAEKLAQMQAEIAKKAAELPPIIESSTMSTQELLELEKKKLEAELASAKAKGDAAEKTFAQIEGEIELNAAIASGNEKEVERIKEKQRQAELTQKIKNMEAEIPAIIEDIIAKTGTSEETARGLAEQLVASRIAALGIEENMRKSGNAANDAGNEIKTVRELIEAANKEKMDNPAKTLKERTEEAKEKLGEMRDFIGEDLNKMSLSSIIKKLGLDVPGLASTDEQLSHIEKAIKDLESADPADLTPEADAIGFNKKLDKIREYLKQAAEEKTDMTPEIDQGKVREATEAARETLDETLTKQPVEVNLDAEKAIGKIREDLKEQIDVAIQSSKGTEHLSSIDRLVSKIESLVIKIEGKLPMQALAY